MGAGSGGTLMLQRWLDLIPDWALLPIGLVLLALCWLADGGRAR